MASEEAHAVPASVPPLSAVPPGAGAGAAAEAHADRELKEIERLFRTMTRYTASDLHLKVGSAPILRIGGRIRNLETAPIGREQLGQMVHEILTRAQAEAFEAGRDLDLAYSIEGVGRWRINVFRQRGSVSVAVRRVRTDVPTFDELHLPGETLRAIASVKQGLVIVAGVTGSGKSTTLAAMIEHINETRRCHIVTIEDPIEYLYRDKKAFINQREIGIDVPDFSSALKTVVRQDPDVILVGEMRDRETFEAGLAASETGHLVFGTLHSSTVAATLSRILDLFPAEREKQIRQSLRFNLRSIICQKILPSVVRGVPLVPCLEILVANPTVQKVIAEGEDKKLETIIRGGGEEGMQDFNQSLMKLVRDGLIGEKTALDVSSNPEQLKMNLKGIFLGDDRKILGDAG